MGWNFLPVDVRHRRLEHNGQTRKELTDFACCRDILPSRSIGLAGATSLRWLASAIPPHAVICGAYILGLTTDTKKFTICTYNEHVEASVH